MLSEVVIGTTGVTEVSSAVVLTAVVFAGMVMAVGAVVVLGGAVVSGGTSVTLVLFARRDVCGSVVSVGRDVGRTVVGGTVLSTDVEFTGIGVGVSIGVVVLVDGGGTTVESVTPVPDGDGLAVTELLSTMSVVVVGAVPVGATLSVTGKVVVGSVAFVVGAMIVDRSDATLLISEVSASGSLDEVGVTTPVGARRMPEDEVVVTTTGVSEDVASSTGVVVVEFTEPASTVADASGRDVVSGSDAEEDRGSEEEAGSEEERGSEEDSVSEDDVRVVGKTVTEGAEPVGALSAVDVVGDGSVAASLEAVVAATDDSVVASLEGVSVGEM